MFLPCKKTLLAVLTSGAAALACDSTSERTTGPMGPDDGLSLSGVSATASGGYHFVVPADFNGGIFGAEVGNRVTFTARRSEHGDVEGRFSYEQEFLGSVVLVKGRVTCFEIYDTPVLDRTPDVPPMTRNRAKWGGFIEQSNFPDDPVVGIGRFAWFQSIDNGEGAGEPSDVSTLAGFGDESANEAFCNSEAVPNPNFGPHSLDGGNIDVR